MRFEDIDPFIDFKDDDKLYVSDFGNGKYISKTFTPHDNDIDEFSISPKIQVRLTYIYEKDDLKGVNIVKTGGKRQELQLSAYDFKMLLATLAYFSQLDFKSIVSGSIILDKSITKANKADIKKFLTTIFSDKQVSDILRTLPNITPSFLQEMARRKRNLETFERLLNDESFFEKTKQKCGIGKDEEVWQKFFTKNDWILGQNIISLADSRSLDEHNTTDIPYRSIDGFLDIIELKLPSVDLWSQSDNSISSKLTKAIMQCMRYERAAEKKSNDNDKIRELGCEIVKPRLTLVIGRSNNWSDQQKESFRLLNSSLTNISILTYDHVLLRAKRLVGD